MDLLGIGHARALTLCPTARDADKTAHPRAIFSPAENVNRCAKFGGAEFGAPAPEFPQPALGAAACVRPAPAAGSSPPTARATHQGPAAAAVADGAGGYRAPCEPPGQPAQLSSGTRRATRQPRWGHWRGHRAIGGAIGGTGAYGTAADYKDVEGEEGSEEGSEEEEWEEEEWEEEAQQGSEEGSEEDADAGAGCQTGRTRIRILLRPLLPLHVLVVGSGAVRPSSTNGPADGPMAPPMAPAGLPGSAAGAAAKLRGLPRRLTRRPVPPSTISDRRRCWPLMGGAGCWRA